MFQTTNQISFWYSVTRINNTHLQAQTEHGFQAFMWYSGKPPKNTIPTSPRHHYILWLLYIYIYT